MGSNGMFPAIVLWLYVPRDGRDFLAGSFQKTIESAHEEQ